MLKQVVIILLSNVIILEYGIEVESKQKRQHDVLSHSTSNIQVYLPHRY